MLRVNLCYYYLCRWPADRLSAVPATADQRGWLLQVQAEPPPPLPALPWELGPPYCRPYSTQCTTLLALFFAVLHTAGPPTLRSASHCGPSSTQYSTLPAPLYAAVIHTAGPPPLRSSDFPFSNSVSFPHDPGHYFACCESVLYHGFWLHVLPCFITFCSLTVSSAFSSDLSSHSP